MEASKKSGVFPIYLVTSKSQHRLAMTFVRFQEHFESPEFAGKVFTLEEFADWYASQHDDFFSYSDDWSGFNIPSWVLEKFRVGMFDPLSLKEKRFLQRTNFIGDPAYFIGMNVAKGIKIGTLRHEMVHALEYVRPDFGEDMRNNLCVSRDIGPFAQVLGRLLRKLREMGYGESVLESEAVAYLITGLAPELSGLDPDFVKSMCNVLRARFKKHFGFSIHRADAVSILDRIHVIDLDGAS